MKQMSVMMRIMDKRFVNAFTALKKIFEKRVKRGRKQL
jgi:hypothetical protein